MPHESTISQQKIVCVCVCACVRVRVPLDEDASLHGMDDAPEPWFLLGSSPDHAHLPGEG